MLSEEKIQAIQAALRAIIKRNLEKVLAFNPFSRFERVVTKDQFAAMLGSDPAFSPFLLNDPKYVTARIGGNLITSLHRKIGDLYQEIFAYLLSACLQATNADLAFALEIEVDGKWQKRSTDGLLRHVALPDRERVRLAALLDLDKVGTAFEVRSCYQIGDSKRIQADRDMALALQMQHMTPIMLIFCASSLISPVARLRTFWTIYEGQAAFVFTKTLTGFDLSAFLGQEQALIHPIMQRIFELM